jgi:hypothetical protein
MLNFYRHHAQWKLGLTKHLLKQTSSPGSKNPTYFKGVLLAVLLCRNLYDRRVEM